MNKCLSKFYVSVRRKDGSFYKRTSLLSVRAALDRHLKSPPHNKTFSICDNHLFSEANKTLNSYLKQLVNEGKIAGTVHKNPLTDETIKKLYERGELKLMLTHVIPEFCSKQPGSSSPYIMANGAEKINIPSRSQCFASIKQQVEKNFSN